MRRVLALIVVVLLMSLVPMTVLANHTSSGGVSATVTPAFVAAVIVEDNLGYGVLNFSDVDKEPVSPAAQNCTTGAETAFSVENTGNVNANFTIAGANAKVADTDTWSLVGTITAADQYIHRFSDTFNACTFVALDTAGQTLKSGVAPATPFNVFLNLDMPTSATSDSSEQSLPITVTAVVP